MAIERATRVQRTLKSHEETYWASRRGWSPLGMPSIPTSSSIATSQSEAITPLLSPSRKRPLHPSSEYGPNTTPILGVHLSGTPSPSKATTSIKQPSMGTSGGESQSRTCQNKPPALVEAARKTQRQRPSQTQRQKAEIERLTRELRESRACVDDMSAVLREEKARLEAEVSRTLQLKQEHGKLQRENEDLRRSQVLMEQKLQARVRSEDIESELEKCRLERETLKADLANEKVASMEIRQKWEQGCQVVRDAIAVYQADTVKWVNEHKVLEDAIKDRDKTVLQLQQTLRLSGDELEHAKQTSEELQVILREQKSRLEKLGSKVRRTGIEFAGVRNCYADRRMPTTKILDTCDNLGARILGISDDETTLDPDSIIISRGCISTASGPFSPFGHFDLRHFDLGNIVIGYVFTRPWKAIVSRFSSITTSFGFSSSASSHLRTRGNLARTSSFTTLPLARIPCTETSGPPSDLLERVGGFAPISSYAVEAQTRSDSGRGARFGWRGLLSRRTGTDGGTSGCIVNAPKVRRGKAFELEDPAPPVPPPTELASAIQRSTCSASPRQIDPSEIQPVMPQQLLSTVPISSIPAQRTDSETDHPLTSGLCSSSTEDDHLVDVDWSLDDLVYLSDPPTQSPRSSLERANGLGSGSPGEDGDPITMFVRVQNQCWR
ncbi:hypothetical protein AAF712_003872 [Marasmius tenuissimus]|uniref:Uncharacterized protein n=1 Tax=Marasmius tenuissimus TaxID=585030 RepID=A0ABR3A755_9AGAR